MGELLDPRVRPELHGPPPPSGVVDLPDAYNAGADLLDERRAGRDGVALVVAGPAVTTVTYADLADRAARFGAVLDDLGVHRGEQVAIVSDDRPEWVSAFVGTVRSGRVAVPLSTLLRPALLGELLAVARPRLVLCDRDRHGTVAERIAALPEPTQLAVLDDPADVPGRIDAADPVAPADTSADEPALVLFTSGTTGAPKGAVHAHRDLAVARCFGAVMGYGPESRLWATSKLFFAFAVGSTLTTGMFAGASVVLNEGPVTPERIADVLVACRPTVLSTVPTLLARIVHADVDPDAFSSVTAVVSAGERLPDPVRERFSARYGVPVLEHLGATEYIHPFTATRPGQVVAGSVGRVMPGVDAVVLADDGHARPGEPGDLWVRGPGVMDHYLHERDATRRTLVGPWLRTGDRVRADAEGNITVLGRSDEMLLVAGMKVSPLDVEAALLRHEAVREAAVVGATDRDGLTEPWAFVIVDREPTAELADDIIDSVRDELPGYARPRRVEFVGDLPRTATGKVRRFLLAERATEELAREAPSGP